MSAKAIEILNQPQTQVGEIATAMVKHLQTYPKEINFVDRSGRTIAHLAIKTNNLEVIKILTHRCDQSGGTIFDRRDYKNKRTPLQQAVYKNRTRIVKFLCAWNKSDLFRSNENETVLHLAVKTGNVEMVRFIINAARQIIAEDGVDSNLYFRGNTPELKLSSFVNQLDHRDNTAIDLAIKQGQIECVHRLLQIEPIPWVTNHNNSTLIHLAVGYERFEILTLLVQKLPAVSILDQSDTSGQTPIHLAVEYKNVNIVNFLVQSGARNLDPVDDRGRTPIYLAVENQNLDMVTRLIQLGATSMFRPDGGGWTPLHEAASVGDEAILNLILTQIPTFPRLHPSRRIDLFDQNGQTPIWVAAANGHEPIVKRLMEVGSRALRRHDSVGRTPFWMAVKSGNIPLIRAMISLLKNLDDIDTVDNKGMTPLFCAARSRDTAAIQVLIQAGSLALDEPNNDGVTPLEMLVSAYHSSRSKNDIYTLKTIQTLIALGADTIRVDVDSMRPSIESILKIRYRTYFEPSLTSRLLNLF